MMLVLPLCGAGRKKKNRPTFPDGDRVKLSRPLSVRHLDCKVFSTLENHLMNFYKFEPRQVGHRFKCSQLLKDHSTIHLHCNRLGKSFPLLIQF
ncbi:hypothetical protein PtB15_5B13 [Puccinia triticina]|nr:hypothetical protein PtB15_5B13 [Puccinia triticina]